MLGFLKNRSLHKSNSADGKAPASAATNHGAELEMLVLSEFVTPRHSDRAARGWAPEVKTSIIRRLADRGDLMSPSLRSRIDIACKVSDLKDMLKERGLPVSGAKPILIQRLIEHDEPGMQQRGASVFECSSTGKVRVEKWQAETNAARDKMATEVLRHLKARQIEQAQKIALTFRQAHPTIQDIGLATNPLAINIPLGQQRRLFEIILSAQPGILAEQSPSDLERVRLAVAMWQLGCVGSGIDMAMDGYTGLARFRPERVRMLLFLFARHVENVEALRRMESFGVLDATILIVDGCDNCKVFNGKTVAINAVPEFPNPHCLRDGCSSIVKPNLRVTHE